MVVVNVNVTNYWVNKMDNSSSLSEFPCRVGICKECLEYVQLIKKNQIIQDGIEYEIWECPECFYPNHINDFLAVDDGKHLGERVSHD